MLLTDTHRKLLADRRAELGLSQTALAERIGITNVWLCNLERGTDPSMPMLRRWCAALGLDARVVIEEAAAPARPG